MEHKISQKSSHRFLMLFTLIIGYEWLASGVSKVLTQTFASGFHHNVVSSLGSAFSFYVPVLKDLVLPHATLFGYFIEFSEVFVGLTFFILFFTRFKNVSGWLLKLGMVASILSAFLSVNIFLDSGDPFFITPAQPFNNSVSLDILLSAMQVSLFAYFYKMNRAKKEENHSVRKTA